MPTLLRRLLGPILLVVVLVAPGFGFLWVPSGHALSCVGFTVEEAYERHEAVIVGRVEAIEPAGTGEHNRTSVTVLRSFKTIEDRQLSVLENVTWGAGFAPSEVGGQYLMYMNKVNDEWEQPLCSSGMPIAHSVNELEWLEAKEIALKPLEESAGYVEGSASAVNNNRSGVIWVIAVSVIAVTAGTAVWVYVARNRKDNH